MLAVEEQRRENLVLEAGQLGAQVVLDQRRRREQRPAWVLLVDDLASRRQNLVCRRQQVTPCASRTSSEESRGRESCDMIVLRLLRRNCLEPAAARRSASRHRVEDGHGRKRQRRAALDGENAVIR
jgi:hypothetical protein